MRASDAALRYPHLSSFLVLIDVQRFSPETDRPPLIHVRLEQLRDLPTLVDTQPRLIAVAIDFTCLEVERAVVGVIAIGLGVTFSSAHIIL